MARIIALLDRDHPQRTEHILVDDVDDAARGRHQIDAKRIGDRLYRARRAGAVELEGATEQIFGQIAEHDISIGHRRQFAAFAISDRARHRARRLRADAQRAREFGNISDRTTARADGLDVERRRADREMTDFGRAHAARLEIFNQRNIGRGAANIERKNILETRILRDPQRARHAPCRSRHQYAHRMFLGLGRRHQPAIRTQQRKLARHPALLQLVAQVRNIFADHRAHRGIGDGGQGALIFLHLGEHFVRERNRRLGHDFARKFADALLMRTINKGVDERDGNRLDALRFEMEQGAADSRLVERADFVACGIDSPANGHRILKRGERGWLGPDDPCRKPAGNERTRDLQDVLEPLGRDEPDACALALEHRIGRDRGAVEHIADRARRDSRLYANRVDAVQYAFGTVMRC